MKRVLISFALVTAVLALSARQLSPAEALNRAIGGDRTSRAVVQPTASEPELVYTASDSLVRPMAYVFSSGEDCGYMIVSADDVAVPLLAYSDSGTFDASSMPDNMRWWLDEYARQIAWASDRADIDPDGSAYAAARASDRPYRDPVAPLVTTRWNQASPYNNMCPKYNDYRCVTGCVATAIAQVMNYNKWPPNGYGTHNYTTSTYNMQVGWNFGLTEF
ncbi:MAG: C10 family peptidase, partial [Muribaculaceae bacterium]|nr:C10 family peptidase [Muribaculaceae bacterium]